MAPNKKNGKTEMTLEDLISTFSEHEIQSDKNFQESLSNFIASNPGIEPPEHFTNHFSLPSALKQICQEILEIKVKLKEKTS